MKKKQALKFLFMEKVAIHVIYLAIILLLAVKLFKNKEEIFEGKNSF
jgi:hypothetical protein